MNVEDAAQASDPAKLRLSRDRLFEFQGEGSPIEGTLAVDYYEKVDDHLWNGDARAAIVVEVDPVVVAAYSDELDCVVMLGFPDVLHEAFNFEPGLQLLAVNLYRSLKHGLAVDLVPGPRDSKLWGNFVPIIGEFFSEDWDRIEKCKSKIKDDEWQRCWDLASAYVEARPGVWRDGLPRAAQIPVAQTRKSFKLD
ncbi:MAG: hypothetical protein ACI8UO_005077 [Verrucomicrobiales bacterium]|jgi:hypothetical protein